MNPTYATTDIGYKIACYWQGLKISFITKIAKSMFEAAPRPS